MRHIPQNLFVLVEDAPKKVGKCVASSEEEMTVEWFHSPTRREKETFQREQVMPYMPPANQRCFWHERETNVWHAGRVLEQETVSTLRVRFPNDVEKQVSLDEVFIRCFDTEADALSLMREKLWETPFFHNKRFPFIKELVAQEAATHGLSALLSARVKLYDHQIDVVRRVLEDPTQRYLLADEVGLGKTVEAAVMLRQAFLDSPNTRALIVVPPHLQAQWQTELRERTQLSSPQHVIQIITHDAWLNGYAIESVGTAFWDIVVVDEAHHIARFALDPTRRRAWERVRAVCHASPRLLLLSATPALHNEDDFLAMLHLLDPAAFPLGERDAFRRKVAGREGVAATLDLVTEDMAYASDLADAAEALRNHLAYDPWITSKLSDFDAVENRLRVTPASVSKQEVIDLAREVRTHICETHRIHRRMLRSSRQRITAEGIVPKRVPSRFKTEWLCGDRSDAVYNGLNAWRDQAVSVDATNQATRHLFRILLSCASTWLPVLREALQLRLGERTIPEWVPLADADVLTTTERFVDEDGVLRNWLRDLERADRAEPEGDDFLHHLDQLLLRHRNGRVVVFTAYTSVAYAVRERLARRIAPRFLYLHTADLDTSQRQMALDQFRSEEDSAVLICDQSGEEGLNLQFTNRIVFLDLPWEPNRLEQRIGRVDRIGSTGELPPVHLLLQEAQDQTSFSEAFYTLVKEGIGLFDSSIADLQFYIEQAVAEWVQAAMVEGAETLVARAATVRDSVTKERRNLRRQAALDTMEAYSVDDGDFAEAARHADNDEQQDRFKKTMQGWLGTLNLYLHPVHKRFMYSPTALLPQLVWNKINEQLPPGRGMAFRRGEISGHAPLDLMRVGHPLVDALLDYARWEDRGRAWAMWRTVTPDDVPDSLRDSPHIYFRFDTICEANYDRFTEHDVQTLCLRPEEQKAVRRRITGWFAPVFETVFVDATTGSAVTEETLRGTLARRYDDNDRSLEKLPWRTIVETVLPDYNDALTQAEMGARHALQTSETTLRRTRDALARAEKTDRIRESQRRLKINAATDTGAFVREQQIHQAIVDAISHFSVRVDAVGLIILSYSEPSVVS